ncbi:MAG: hypothetical protein LBB25_00775 [Holosporaceae bacterium]|jgi:bacterioferritin-associated ferredoxin|nr:hypothetical protein [Holosporaceae bacterium]
MKKLIMKLSLVAIAVAHGQVAGSLLELSRGKGAGTGCGKCRGLLEQVRIAEGERDQERAGAADLRKEVARQQGMVALLQQQKSAAETELAGAKTGAADLRKEVARQQGMIAMLQQQKSAAEAELAGAKANLERLTQEREATLNASAGLNAELAKARRDLQVAASAKAQADTNLAHATADLAAMAEEKTRAESNLTELRSRLGQMENAAERTAAELADLRTDAENARRNLAESERLEGTAREAALRLQQEQTARDEEIQRMKDTEAALLGRIEVADRRLAKLEPCLKTREAAQRHANAGLSAAKVTIAKLTEEKTAVESALAELRMQLEHATAAARAMEEKLRTAERDMGILTADKQRLEEVIAAERDAATILRKDKIAAEKARMETLEQMDGLTDQIRAREVEVRQLTAALETAKRQNETTPKALTEAKRREGELKRKLRDKENELVKLRHEMTALETRLTENERIMQTMKMAEGGTSSSSAAPREAGRTIGVARGLALSEPFGQEESGEVTEPEGRSQESEQGDITSRTAIIREAKVKTGRQRPNEGALRRAQPATTKGKKASTEGEARLAQEYKMRLKFWKAGRKSRERQQRWGWTTDRPVESLLAERDDYRLEYELHKAGYPEHELRELIDALSITKSSTEWWEQSEARNKIRRLTQRDDFRRAADKIETEEIRSVADGLFISGRHALGSSMKYSLI